MFLDIIGCVEPVADIILKTHLLPPYSTINLNLSNNYLWVTNTSCENCLIAVGACLTQFTPVDSDYITAVSSSDVLNKQLLSPNTRPVHNMLLSTIHPGVPAPKRTEVLRLLERLRDIFEKINPSSEVARNVHPIDTGDV